MLDTATKQRIIGEYQAKPGDTGSTEVQVALLSERIRGLTDHLRRNHKDHATRRGLLKLVGQRRRLLRYLAREDVGRYRTVISRLGLRITRPETALRQRRCSSISQLTLLPPLRVSPAHGLRKTGVVTYAHVP